MVVDDRRMRGQQANNNAAGLFALPATSHPQGERKRSMVTQTGPQLTQSSKSRSTA